ncbi:MAG: NTP transferase domain-containing protein [Planctomycetota bacterium]
MKKFHVIVLAGGEKGPLFETTGYIEKALIPIHEKPMLSHVIEAFHASERVDKIVVVGSANLDKLETMTHVRKRIFNGFSVVQNLLHAVTYVKHRLYAGMPDHNGYVISFCDAVFLTPEIIDDTLKTIEEIDSDIVLHYVEKSTFAEAGLPTSRTYIPLGGQYFTGSTIYYVKRFSKVLKAMPRLAELRKHRKNPQALLQHIGCEDADISMIEQTMSRELAARVHIRISKHARIALDVDKPSDLELANQVLTQE